MSTNSIMVPATEVRRRTREWLDWYNNGGRDGLEAEYTAKQKQLFRDQLKGATKGIINKRPWSEEEIEAEVERRMQDGDMLDGKGLVDMKMWSLDDKIAREIRELHNAASGGSEMAIRTYIWTWIIKNSSEPVAQPTAD